MTLEEGGDTEGRARVRPFRVLSSPGPAGSPCSYTSRVPPSVSVVTPVHNCMPYLDDAIASVYHQTLGRSEIEMVAVDDGSTDGSAACLRAWAERWPGLTVVTQEASGAPGRPRNVGIGHASGEYLFFLDGDDCLGPRALERMLGMARANGSDIVLGKIVGVDRRAPVEPFAGADIDRADLTSGIYYSLAPVKLFRRQFVLDQGLTFPEHIRISEDQHFVVPAYLAASVISVVASYDCYYAVKRTDGSNTTAGGLPYRTIVSQAAEVVAMLWDRVPPGEVRDRLMVRHVREELLRRFDGRFPRMDAAEREETVRLAQQYVDAWAGPGVIPRLTVPERLRVAAIQRGDTERLLQIVEWDLAGRPARTLREGEHWLLAGPFFRDPEVGFADSLYVRLGPPRLVEHLDRVAWDGGRLVLEGYAFLEGVDARHVTLALVASHRDTGEVREAVVEPMPSPHVNALAGRGSADYSRAGYRAVLDLGSGGGAAPASPGVWQVRLQVRCGSHETSRRVGSSRAGDVPGAPVETRLRGAGFRSPARIRFGDGGALSVQVGPRVRRKAGAGKPAPPQPASATRRLAARLRGSSPRRTR